MYLDAVLNGVEGDLSVLASMTVVQSAGKPRPLSKFSSDSLLLRPLHGALYEQLSKFSWLCRGDPTAEKLEKAGFKRGAGVLVSGDYKSATDNLPTEVAEAALKVALAHSVCVPASIKRYALAILRPTMFSIDWDVEFVPSVGQMMGSLLSFPLLCLQNYLAFRWARHSLRESKRLPLLINGDDILFQSSEQFARGWMNVVSSVGLEVESSKTSISEEYGSLNSTLFRWSDSLLWVVPTIRMGMLKASDYVVGAGLSFSSFVKGLESGLRYRAACCWFSYRISQLRSSRMTLPELGFSGSLALRMEKKFSLPSNLAPCLPPKSPTGHNVALSSEEFIKVPAGSLGREEEEINSCEMVAWKWSVRFSESRVRSVIRYCLQLSAIRPRVIDFSEPFWVSRLTRQDCSGSGWRRRFFPRVILGKEVFCSVNLVFSQYFTTDVLPRYEDDVSIVPSYEEALAAPGFGGDVA
jgi:hypothetical protein